MWRKSLGTLIAIPPHCLQCPQCPHFKARSWAKVAPKTFKSRLNSLTQLMTASLVLIPYFKMFYNLGATILVLSRFTQEIHAELDFLASETLLFRRWPAFRTFRNSMHNIDPLRHCN